MSSLASNPIKSRLAILSKAVGSAVLVIKSDIDSECRADVTRLISGIGEQERLMVLLESPGGSIEDAFWIAKELRLWCGQLDIAVTGWAKSAATLIALAADRILFGSSGELGPLDVQLHDFSGGARRISPLETIRGMEFLRNYYLETFHHIMNILVETLDVSHAIEQATKLLAPIATPLYQLVDYRQLGDAFRHLSVSEAYARGVMLRWSPMKDDKDSIDSIVRQLVWEYPYHGHIIDFDECLRIGLRNSEQMLYDIAMMCRCIIAIPEQRIIAVYGGGAFLATNSLAEEFQNGTTSDEEE